MGRIRSRLRRGAGAVVGMALLAAMAAAPTSAGSPGLALTDVIIGSFCFTGTPSGSGDPIDIELRDAGAVLKDSATIATPIASPTEVCFAQPILAGDHLVIVGTRDVTVPALRIKSIDRNGDVVAIRGVPGTQVQLRAHRCALGTGFNVDFCAQKTARNVTLDGAGKRSVDLTSALDLRSHDLVQVRYRPTVGDLFRATAPVPGLFLRVGSTFLDGVLPIGVTGSYQLRAKDGTVRATTQLTGSSETTFGEWQKDSAAVPVAVGDKVTGDVPANLSIAIPKGPTLLDAATDVVKGRCFKGGKVMIENLVDADVVFTAAADGTFSKDLSSKGGFDPGDEALITCVTKAFDLVEYQVTAP